MIINKGAYNILKKDGEIKKLKCISCKNPSCINPKHNKKLDLPVYLPQSLCPTEALTFDNNNLNINHKKCISCGNCAFMCINKSIFYNYKNNSFEIMKTDRSDFAFIKELNEKENFHLRDKLSISENKFFNKLKLINQNNKKELISNLLNIHGIENYAVKTGQHIIRSDLLIYFKKEVIISEIELNKLTVLEKPREILENYLMLKNKNIVNVSKNVFIFILNFPNKRSDYWEVLYDIFKVTNIKIYTIPILKLFEFNWQNISSNMIDFIFDNYFITKKDIDKFQRKSMNNLQNDFFTVAK